MSLDMRMDIILYTSQEISSSVKRLVCSQWLGWLGWFGMVLVQSGYSVGTEWVWCWYRAGTEWVHSGY